VGNVKQVLVVRKDLKMRVGKVAAQCAHASMKVFLDRKELHYGIKTHVCFDVTEVELSWITGSFTKICVGCQSEAELLDLYEKAKAAGLPCALVQDSGKTEFHGVPTYTVVAIGPDDSDRIDPLTGALPLL